MFAAWVFVEVIGQVTCWVSLAGASLFKRRKSILFKSNPYYWAQCLVPLSAQFMVSNFIVMREDSRWKWRLLLHPSEIKKKGVLEKGRHHNYSGQLVASQESLEAWLRGEGKEELPEGREQPLLEQEGKERSWMRHKIICKGKERSSSKSQKSPPSHLMKMTIPIHKAQRQLSAKTTPTPQQEWG